MIDQTKSEGWYTSIDVDVQLMLRVRDDDERAFEQIMDRNRSGVIAMLLRYVRERAVAEELAQEVFLRVYLARKRYVPRSKFSTWILMIAINLGLNARRSDSRRAELQAIEPHRDYPDCGSQAPDGKLAHAELWEVVRQGLDQLPERQSEALQLRLFGNLSYAQVAEQMNTSSTAVKSLLMRARDNLRRSVDEYLDPAIP